MRSVVVTDRERLRDLARVWRGSDHVARSAATIVLAAPVLDEERTRNSAHYDHQLGQVTMSMILAAADLGIGNGHTAVGDQDCAGELLNLPEDRELASMIAFGYPRTDRSRRSSVPTGVSSTRSFTATAGPGAGDRPRSAPGPLGALEIPRSLRESYGTGSPIETEARPSGSTSRTVTVVPGGTSSTTIT